VKAESRKQKAESRKQKAESRKQKEGGSQASDGPVRRREARNQGSGPNGFESRKQKAEIRTRNELSTLCTCCSLVLPGLPARG